MATYFKKFPVYTKPVKFVLYEQKNKNPNKSDKAVSVIFMDDHGNGTGLMVDIYTEPKYRRKGYASTLLNLIKESGYFKEIYTSWDSSTERGRSFCLRNKFVLCRLSNEKWLVWKAKDDIRPNPMQNDVIE